MNTKTTIAIFAAVAVLAVALAPLVTSADAARSTQVTCNGEPGPCPGNSGSNGNDNKCQTSVTRTGQGGGSGTIKEGPTETC
jgi:hypothetical protein